VAAGVPGHPSTFVPIDADHTYAAIDIGSNAVRLLIGGILERTDHPVVKKVQLVRVPVRLGEDVFGGGGIGNDRRDHLIKTIKAFRLLIDVYGVNYFRACATSAMREAANQADVLARVEMETGIDIEVIDGRTEADLITNTFWTQDLLKDRDYLYIDVGGGSTQLTWLRHGRRMKSRSFRIGAVRMLKDRVEPAEWDQVTAFLAEVHDATDGLMGIGTGGNINRLFKENGNRYGEPLEREHIRRQRDRIAAFSVEDRVKLLRLREDRADVVVPAAEIYLRIMREAGIQEIFVPKVGLVDGIVYDLYMKRLGHLRYARPEASPVPSN